MGSKREGPKCATTCNKYNKKQRKMGLSVGKKAKENRVKNFKVKQVVKHLTEYLENESTSIELTENRKISSSESLIYRTTCNSEGNQCQSVSRKDLTDKNETLRMLDFNQRNLDQSLKYRKPSTTSSIMNLSVIKKTGPKKLNSTSMLPKPNPKLAVLDIPSQFLSYEDLIFNKDEHFFKKCNLNERDNKLINWIIQQENESIDLSINLSPTSLSYDYSMRLGLSVEQMVNIYGVSFKDNFN